MCARARAEDCTIAQKRNTASCVTGKRETAKNPPAMSSIVREDKYVDSEPVNKKSHQEDKCRRQNYLSPSSGPSVQSTVNNAWWIGPRDCSTRTQILDDTVIHSIGSVRRGSRKYDEFRIMVVNNKNERIFRHVRD